MGRAYGLDFSALAALGALGGYPMAEIAIMFPFVEAGVRDAARSLSEDES